MKGYSKVIYLVGLLSLLIAKSAIASDITPSAIGQKNTSNTIKTCEKSQAQVFSSVNKTKNTEKVSPHASVTSNKNSPSNTTPESFWWAASQFDPFGGKLIQNWLTYPQKQQINLIVNWQLWTLLDYLGRYRFVNQFGTVARKYGYNLNVFNQKEQCLAAYQYNALGNPPKWELTLEKLGQDSLQINTN